mgnify:CR=1 FL=1
METKTQKLVSSAELLNEIFIDLKEKFLNSNLSGLRSGFEDLDSIIQGFQKSDQIIPNHSIFWRCLFQLKRARASWR